MGAIFHALELFHERDKEGYWSSLRPVPFLNVLCPMVYSSLALSVWSLLFPPFFFLYWLYCDDHGWMSCITECRPSMDAFFWDQLCLFERKSFKNLPFLMIWSTVWSMRWSEIKDMICYFSSCIFPVFDRIKVPVFISTEFPVCLSLFICSGWHRIIWSVRSLSNKF